MANAKLHCSGPGILVWAYANGSLDNDGNIMNGITPIVHVNGTLNISHFDILNKGFYICTSSASTYTKESVLITSGKCYRNGCRFIIVDNYMLTLTTITITLIV